MEAALAIGTHAGPMVTSDNEGEHLIAAYVGLENGPTVIAIGGLHGNETSGVAALERVSGQLEAVREALKGRVYFLKGNTRALSEGMRFLDQDLNRSWTPDNIASAFFGDRRHIREMREVSELDRLLDSILITAEDEVYVIDLHSTSAGGPSFATVGDTLRNREFARRFPVTILLGIEEQLEGTLLEYLNTAGAVTMGFEGGQHASEEAIKNHESLIWLALANSGSLPKEKIPNFEMHRDRLAQDRAGAEIFEVRYRHPVNEDDQFQMRHGFVNFQKIRRGQVLAGDRSGDIAAREGGVVLMPLYQKLGEDGFFIGRRVARFWLWLSGVLRRLGVQEWMPVLPGVRLDEYDASTLRVNTRIARLFPLQVFHLLGYRKRRWAEGELVVSRRKHDTRSPFRRGRNDGR